MQDSMTAWGTADTRRGALGPSVCRPSRARALAAARREGLLDALLAARVAEVEAARAGDEEAVREACATRHWARGQLEALLPRPQASSA